MKHRTGLIVGITVLLILVLSSAVIISNNRSQNTKVTIRFEGNYPWLVLGAFADYRSYNNGEAPSFITSSGQLLMLAPELPGTPNNPVNGWLPGTGSVSLNWTVANRSGNNVSINVSFSNVGCQDNETASVIGNQSAAPCTYYNYAKSISVTVNLTSNEANVGGVDQGLVDFWEPSLLTNATIESGSVFVNQQRFDSVANVSSVELTSILGISPGFQSANVYSNSLEIYDLTPTTFGISNLIYHIGWLNGSATASGGQQETTFGPTGYYDYYNGLAYEFDLPQYAINQTICNYDHGQPTNCRLANVSTTLGQYFRSALGTMLLTSTNIALSSTNQQSTNSAVPPAVYGFLRILSSPTRDCHLQL